MPTPAGAVDEFSGGFVPGDLFQGERGAQKILCQAASAFGIVGGDGFFSGVEVEAAVGPAEELVQFGFADEFFASEGGEEAMAEDFLEWFDRLHGHFVEGTVPVDQAGGGDDVEVGVEDEVIAERLHSGDGGELPVWEIETGVNQSCKQAMALWKRRVRSLRRFRKMPRSGFGIVKTNWR
jgi:hypothetical protein